MKHVPSIPFGARSSRRQRGASLIESLVAILIFSVGIVGNLGLMAQMTRAQGAALWKSQASMLSAEVVALMWADSEASLGLYTAGCSNQRCIEWKKKVAEALPGGSGTVESLGGNIVKVAIDWTIPGEGAHNYAIQTTIAR